MLRYTLLVDFHTFRYQLGFRRILWYFLKHYRWNEALLLHDKLNITAVKNGDLHSLIVPVDSNGRKCGEDAEVKNASYLVYIDIRNCHSITNCDIESVCRKECPSLDYFAYSLEKKEAIQNGKGPKDLKDRMICTSDKLLEAAVNDNSWTKLDNLVKAGKCAEFYFKSEPIVNRCIPSISDKVSEIIDQEIKKSEAIIKALAESERVTKNIWHDVQSSW